MLELPEAQVFWRRLWTKLTVQFKDILANQPFKFANNRLPHRAVHARKDHQGKFFNRGRLYVFILDQQEWVFKFWTLTLFHSVYTTLI